MTSSDQPSAALIGPLENCGTEKAIRHINNDLYTRTEKNETKTEESVDFNLPSYTYGPLRVEPEEARLLRLHPTDDPATHVRCNLETHLLAELPSFVAVQNARGFRNLKEAIEIDGGALLISFALERFLRYLRTKINKPSLVWVRYICVVEFDPKEQKAYWTRDFSDKMYAKAAEVIDMHEINSLLIENGYFEKAGHGAWEKEWYRSSEEMVLPRVCPIRLGTKADNEAPTMNYRYMPLDAIADEIRIVCIMPATDRAAPIVVHAAHCPIKCEVTFIALSYRWGTDETPEEIVMNGQRKNIRQNLAAAIRSIRMADCIVPMWIDAISINQDDMVERGRQVRRMGQIYDNAMYVYSYVGPPDDDTEDVIEFIVELGKHPMVRSDDNGSFILADWEATSVDRHTIQPRRLGKLCVILYRFLTRQYFRRLWILQEVAWATSPSIFTAHKLGVTWDNLDMAAYNLQDMLIRDPSLVSHMLAADPSLEHVNMEMLAYARKVFYFRYLISEGRGVISFLFPSRTIKKTSPGFLEAMILARNLECTDPRDRIFALWNLAQDKAGLDYTPIYTKSYEEVYAGFAQAWMMQHGALDILGAVEATQQSSDFYTKTPSWCPNWNVPSTASSLVRKDYLPTRPMLGMHDLGGRLYSADGGVSQDLFETPLFAFTGGQLQVTGLIIDQISHVFEDAPDIPTGTAPKSRWRVHYLANAINKHYHDHKLTTYDDVPRALKAMFHGDGVAAWPPVAESGYEPDTGGPEESYACLPNLSRHVTQYAGSWDRTEAWTALDAVLRGRRPIVTVDGYMGLASAYLPDGDAALWSIAVVAGCSVPLILREREGGTYELVGTCFIQGWMDGEWMATMMDAESAKEFWEAAMDGAKIVIS